MGFVIAGAVAVWVSFLVTVGRWALSARLKGTVLEDEFDAAAEALGLSASRGIQGPAIYGEFRGVYVNAAPVIGNSSLTGSSWGGAEWEATFSGLPKSLSFQRLRVEARERVLTGVPAFDRDWVCAGPEATVLACLNPAVRALLSESRVAGREGDVVVFGSLSPQELAGMVETSAKIVTVIAEAAKDIPASLAAGVRREPNSSTRVRCLKLLRNEFPSAPAHEDARRAALDSQDEELRGFAVRSGTDEAACLALEARIQDPSVEFSERFEDLERRAALPPSESFAHVARSLLSEPSLQRGAVKALGVMRDRESFERIASLTGSPDKGLAAEAVRALGRIGGTDAEPRLIALLSDGDAGLRQSAMEAIGETGSERGLEALESANSSVPQRKELEAARLRAVQALQSRRTRS